MRTILTAFVAIILTIEMIYPVGAVNTPNVDEIEMMLKRIEQNMKMASVVVSSAKKQSEKLVEQKVEERQELKEAVAVAETKIEKMEEKIEIYAVKMIGGGIDTSFQEVQFGGKIYEAYLNYLEEGGKEDFEYFRLYLWQPK
jgi:hypothetical protein